MIAQGRESQDSSRLHDEKASLLDELEYIRGLQRHRDSKRRTWLYVLVAMIATNTLSVLITSRIQAGRLEARYNPDLEASHAVFSGLDRSYSLIEFSEHKLNHTSKYTAPPNPAVDRAWVELGARDGGFLLPQAAGERLGLNRREHLYSGRGVLENSNEEGFHVLIQGYHDLHCVNELRRALYYNKAYYKQYEDDTLVSEWFRRSHINHCLDNVRERLMCTADIGLIPSVYTGPHTTALQFANKHKCRSFDRVLEWKAEWMQDHPAWQRIATAEQEIILPINAPSDAIFHDPSTLSGAQET